MRKRRQGVARLGRRPALEQLTAALLEVASKINIPRKWLSIQESAVYLGIAQSTLYQWKSRKKIKAATIGGVVRFAITDLDAFMEKRK